MRDGGMEDRLRAVLRGDGDALPLTITPDELERRLVLRRRERIGRRVSYAAAGIAAVLVVSLVGASNGWFGTSGIGAVPSESASVAPSVEPGNGGLSCSAIDPSSTDRPPTLIMGATPGDAMAYGGALVGYVWGGSAVDVDADPAIGNLTAVAAGPPTERLQVLASELEACLTSVTAQATSDGGALELGVFTTEPARVVEFAKPPVGEWMVRVHVEFSTTNGSSGSSDTVFRVDTRDRTASGAPRPGTLPELATPEGTILAEDASESDSPGEFTGTTSETVLDPIPARGQYRVDVVCLGFAPLRWSLGIEGQFEFLAAGDQVCDGTPTSREVVLGTPTTNLPVIIQADPAAAWHIVLSTVVGPPAFVPPALRMIETGNTEGSAGAAQAFGRCISTAEASDQCAGEWFVLDGARSILVPVGSRLTFGLEDGWQIDEARITAAATETVRANTFAPEYSVGFVDSGGPLITVPVELDRGSWIVRVALNASRNEETFGAYYDLPLEIGE